jgi:hypothetical protein
MLLLRFYILYKKNIYTRHYFKFSMYLDRQETLMSDNESERIEIFFSARNLTNLDVVSDTDSFLRVYLR